MEAAEAVLGHWPRPPVAVAPLKACQSLKSLKVTFNVKSVEFTLSATKVYFAPGYTPCDIEQSCRHESRSGA